MGGEGGPRRLTEDGGWRVRLPEDGGWRAKGRRCDAGVGVGRREGGRKEEERQDGWNKHRAVASY